MKNKSSTDEVNLTPFEEIEIKKEEHKLFLATIAATQALVDVFSEDLEFDYENASEKSYHKFADAIMSKMSCDESELANEAIIVLANNLENKYGISA